MKSQLRAIVGARVSVLNGPQKVSHHAQLETATKWAESNGYEIVGAFEDLGVSASVPPAQRPDLGQWLTPEGADGWDAIVWSKMDRAFRSTKHCVDFAQWAEENQKVVVFAEDGLKLDYRPGATKGIDAMMAELFVYLGSFFAQLELNRFKTRAEDAHRVLRGMTRWPGGTAPLGYRVVDHPSGKGKGLEPDPEGKARLYEMAGLLLDGWSFTRIADYMNEKGYLTNKDRALVEQGKQPKGRGWSVTTVVGFLTSARTQGLKVTGSDYGGKMVLDDQGQPIRLAPPTFDDATWDQIQQAVALRKLNTRSRTWTQNPMLGVGYCSCGASLSQKCTPNNYSTGTTYRYYQCGRTPTRCTGTSVKADELDELLEGTFIAKHGHKHVTRKVFVPGEDHTYELEQTNRTIDNLREDRALGLYSSPADQEKYRQQMAALVANRDRLAAIPARSAGWTTEVLPETYAEVWDTRGHRELLLEKGVRMTLISSKPVLNIDLFVPDDEP
ncbi:integrase [Mycolicibacterium mucogenicum]|uniref:Integrase n=1 Tax=Mycolicibacterium mucogenicum TaxID=56689 RepID=A0A1A3GZT7_MYCMU|nr:recombinase family protein [Mycolicibacterium mucogenicum]OBJ41315.1 integrase [Mycolicibacterium mucogenicum]